MNSFKNYGESLRFYIYKTLLEPSKKIRKNTGY